MFKRMFFSGASIEIGIIPIEAAAAPTTKPWYFRYFILGRRG